MAQVEASSPSYERQENAELCVSWPLCFGLSIFREVWGVWQGSPIAATIEPGHVAPVEEYTVAVCFPTDAVAVPPENAKGPDDYGPELRCGTKAQIVLGYASEVPPTATLACPDGSRVLVHSAARSPAPSAPDQPPGRQSRQTS